MLSTQQIYAVELDGQRARELSRRKGQSTFSDWLRASGHSVHAVAVPLAEPCVPGTFTVVPNAERWRIQAVGLADGRLQAVGMYAQRVAAERHVALYEFVNDLMLHYLQWKQDR